MYGHCVCVCMVTVCVCVWSLCVCMSADCIASVLSVESGAGSRWCFWCRNMAGLLPCVLLVICTLLEKVLTLADMQHVGMCVCLLGSYICLICSMWECV